MAKTKIADLSHYQGKIDWSKAAVELAFCILRASVGVNTDKKYAEYVQGCKENGIPFHAYHYLKATTTEEAVEEAQHFYKAASAAEPLFYVADVEYGKIPASSARAITSAFISELKRLGAKRTAIYVGHHLFSKFNLATGEVDYLWIPRYGKNSGTPETRPSYPCDLWQYTSNGKLAGVSGRVDLNQLTGTKPLSYFTDLAQPDEEPKKGDTAMAYDPKKVIAIAEAEVGYLEKASNKNLDSKTANAGSKNYTKYARDMDAIPNFYNGKKQGVAWCDIFVDWCFVQAYGVEAARALLCQPLKSSGAGCKYSRGYYKAKGQLHTSNPQPGDQIFFWPSDRSDPNAVAHTGLVYDVDKTRRNLQRRRSMQEEVQAQQFAHRRVWPPGLRPAGIHADHADHAFHNIQEAGQPDAPQRRQGRRREGAADRAQDVRLLQRRHRRQLPDPDHAGGEGVPEGERPRG